MDKGGSTKRLRAVVDASVVVKWGFLENRGEKKLIS